MYLQRSVSEQSFKNPNPLNFNREGGWECVEQHPTPAKSLREPMRLLERLVITALSAGFKISVGGVGGPFGRLQLLGPGNGYYFGY